MPSALIAVNKLIQPVRYVFDDPAAWKTQCLDKKVFEESTRSGDITIESS